MIKSIAMCCAVGMMALLMIGAEPAAPVVKPTTLPVTFAFFQSMNAPAVGMKGNFPMVLEVKNDTDDDYNVAKKIEVTPVEHGVKIAQQKLKSSEIHIRVTVELPELPSGVRAPQANAVVKSTDKDPEKVKAGKNDLFKFHIPGEYFVAPGVYRLKAEAINSDEFPCVPSEWVEITCQPK